MSVLPALPALTLPPHTVVPRTPSVATGVRMLTVAPFLASSLPPTNKKAPRVMSMPSRPPRLAESKTNSSTSKAPFLPSAKRVPLSNGACNRAPAPVFRRSSAMIGLVTCSLRALRAFSAMTSASTTSARPTFPARADGAWACSAKATRNASYRLDVFFKLFVHLTMSNPCVIVDRINLTNIILVNKEKLEFTLFIFIILQRRNDVDRLNSNLIQSKDY